MKFVAFLFLSVLVSGCAPFLPGAWSAHHRFLKEHPGAEILTLKKQEVIDPASTPPRFATRRYADYVFRYRSADSVEHEDVWHYEHSIHGWYFVKKEQTR